MKVAKRSFHLTLCTLGRIRSACAQAPYIGRLEGRLDKLLLHGAIFHQHIQTLRNRSSVFNKIKKSSETLKKLKKLKSRLKRCSHSKLQMTVEKPKPKQFQRQSQAQTNYYLMTNSPSLGELLTPTAQYLLVIKNNKTTLFNLLVSDQISLAKKGNKCIQFFCSPFVDCPTSTIHGTR